MLKALAISLGLEPDKVLSKEALNKPHRTLIDSQSQEKSQITALTQAIKIAIIEELGTNVRVTENKNKLINVDTFFSLQMAHEICALCRQQKDLKRSHIIPRFVGKWLKDTSATGKLRGVVEPDERMQDLPTLNLLCEDCEQIFSKLESYFASHIFYPFFNEDIKVIEYDDNLLRFIISLSWRTLKTSYQDQIKYSSWIKEYVDEAEEIWRKYLLQETLDPGPYEHHMFFLDFMESGPNIPDKFQWYTLRGTDATLVSNEKIVFAYTHFPWIFFVSTIFPMHLSGWKGTRIKIFGKITRSFNIEDDFFGNFLINRVRKFHQVLDGSEDDRILKTLEKNSERFLLSDSFKVMIEESKRERQEKLKKMPKGIQALVDIIDRSLNHPELDPLQQRWVNFNQHIIANSLTNMPKEKALKIHHLIDSSLYQADITQPDIKYDFKTEEIIGRFMVNFCATKDEQRELLNISIDELVKERSSNDKRFIIVFSYNPLDAELPFETGYYIE